MMQKSIAFTLNGKPVQALVKTHHTLVDVLRDQFFLDGARESCAQGMCGCCTVLVNGKPVSGCLFLAAFADGADVRTIENLGDGKDLHPIQQAFIENYGFQCGFCTSGMILMAQDLLDQNPNPSRDEIRHHLSGNLCRCAGYDDVLNSVEAAAKKLAEKK